ncbi:MAG: gliding motility-associated C-terminal domain-containing protein, partial [Flavobacteriaceae bacterium]|nr:gliding motility-associated C-terminal domain-containing protein [Flavobacteriaceae bacterium]
TDANGNFTVDVPAGINVYEINENEPDFPIGAIQTEGTNPTEVFVASDTDNFGGDNGFFSVEDSDDFGLITGLVYLDENGNGTLDPNEDGIPDLAITIIDNDGNIQTIFTDENGIYNAIVIEGEVLINVDQSHPNFPEGAIQTEGSNPSLSFIIVGTQTQIENKGFFIPDQTVTGELLVHLYFDLNGNGTQDPGEPDMENVEVIFTNVFGDTFTSETDINGDVLTEMVAGNATYEINEEDPDFPFNSTQTEGTNPTDVFIVADEVNFGGNNGFFDPDLNEIGLLTAHLYFDLNGNGTQDASEPDMPNIQVEITNANGEQSTVITDENGDFFINTFEGFTTYTILTEEPDFPEFAIQTQGNNPTNVIVIANETAFGGNNGFFVPEENIEGILSARVYLDENGNGIQDNNEPGIESIEVIVTNVFNEEESVFTDENGDFSVVVPSGPTSFFINEEDVNFPEDAIQTEGVNPTFDIFVPVNDIIDAGNNGFFVPSNQEQGVVFMHIYLDENGNGNQDPGEPSLEGVEVQVTDSNANEILLVSDENGNVFTQVVAGNVSLFINEDSPVFPPGIVQTEGNNPTEIFVGPNTTVFAGDQGFFVPNEEFQSSIRGRVYFDANGNGELDLNEQGIANVEIEITDAFNDVFTISTDVLGNFETNIPAGTTSIFIEVPQQNLPEDAVLTEGEIPQTILLTPEENFDFGNFGYVFELEEDEEEEEDDELIIYNAVHPNGDGRNDFFRIEGIENFPSNNLKIYNRSGIKVFDVNNYGLNGNLFVGISEGRVSIQKNKRLPAGTYFYLFEYRDIDGSRKNKQGYLYLK